MRVGLSRRKSEYIIGIAKATTEGKLNFDELTKKVEKNKRTAYFF